MNVHPYYTLDLQETDKGEVGGPIRKECQNKLTPQKELTKGPFSLDTPQNTHEQRSKSKECNTNILSFKLCYVVPMYIGSGKVVNMPKW